ncbi:MAG: type II CRISPR RNA-guided endonuclease Cas9 [Anditalea sp.]
MEKILGTDLGTNSIGMALRDGRDFPWYGVYTFKKGVGEGKSGEYSFAAERTLNRATRRLYNARRYRKWETLNFLIANGYCPLSKEKLHSWKYYDKENGRVFPVDDDGFNSWIKLDFDGDGIPDYSSPYQLRRELINSKLDLEFEVNRFKIGRALYHIAQRRGFKSSRKNGANEKVAVYKGSTETSTIGRNEYEEHIHTHGTLGAAFAALEDEGIRIRNRYTLRADYEKEVDLICEIQGLSQEQFREPVKKAIFFQRRLRSQKGLVGKCTLEPQKSRCPVSHLAYEEFRAWSFLNNVKWYDESISKWASIPLYLKTELYNDKFFLKGRNDFKFSQISKYLQKATNKKWRLNFIDETLVPACPISARLRSIFGNDWKNFSKTVTRENRGKQKSITYTIEDVWHLLFSFEDEEIFLDFVSKTFDFNEEQAKEINTLWESFPIGYAALSLKAIKNILPFLRRGLIYTEAVLLAKIPELIGTERFAGNENHIINSIVEEIEKNRKEKKVVSIINKLISDYFLLERKFGLNDTNYLLDDDDKNDILNAIVDVFGAEVWEKEESKNDYVSRVTILYQVFFKQKDRKHFLMPHLLDQINEFLQANFEIEEKHFKKMYHPSQIEVYPPAKRDENDGNLYLQSPKTGAFKNPMAYKTLHELRKVFNHLISIGKIDEDTRIVVEVARELNDANKRWAIEAYQRARENENREIAFAITELLKDPEFSGLANPDSQTDKEKLRLWTEQSENPEEFWKGVLATKDDVKKYRLWKEQGCQCIYTGKTIKFTDLFNKNIIDFEHTIPRSKSFDNSLANLAICYADYNRNVKRNNLPVNLPNYEVDAKEGSAIKPRLDRWEKRMEALFQQIDKAKASSKYASDKASKDLAIRRKHMLQMEYEYWKNKVDRFTRNDVPKGFKNSQLTDSQLISKYAFHYLKTVFNRVDVQKGSVTSDFRKIYGIQPKNEVKDRTKHYHHAIDAAVLTLIPKAAERDRLLEDYYSDQEHNREGNYPIKPFEGFDYGNLEEIKKNILINNIPTKDQAFAPGRKVIRKRGRIVWLRNKEGKLILDENGEKQQMMAQGDSVRGQLHLDTFYGKIKAVARDENDKPLRDESGKFVFNQVKGRDEMWVVGRKPIRDIKIGADEIVDKHLEAHISKQIESEISLSELKDFNGNIIRHLRVRVKAGRGHLDADKVTELKAQTYPSKYDYKRFYYTNSGENYAFGYYKGVSERKIVPINLFEASMIKKLAGSVKHEDLFERTIFIGKGKNKVEVELSHIFKVGQKVIFYENDVSEIRGLSNFSDKLYYVKKLADAKQGLIQFQHHLESRSDDQLSLDLPTSKGFGQKGKNGFSKYSSVFLAPRLLLSPGNLTCIIEGKDFEFLLDGQIRFKNL